jgi:steroid 5-alpha reductase family enzyme
MSNSVKGFGGALVAVLVGLGIAWAGSHGSISWHGLPLFAVCGLLAYAVQWVVFVPSFIAHTEHYFDLTGSITYLSLTLLALFAGNSDPRALVIATLVVIWALRLGSFLFVRVKQDGSDGRFDELKHSFPMFLMTWTLQGLWVFLTLAAALAAITSAEAVPLGPLAFAGIALWVLGFGMEAVADAQKRTFRKDPANAGRFITTGLWAWSRHPNYFGEITLWVGIALIAAETLSGWRWVTMISPVFVYVLLNYISGVPLLESRGKKRWGDDPEYQAYKARTPVLFPRPPRSG